MADSKKADYKDIPETGCCPKFDPSLWDEKEIKWDSKLFVKDTVTCLFHIPLNMGSVMKRMHNKVLEAGAGLEDMKDFVLLSHDRSSWKSDQYYSVKKEVPDMENVKLSGTFMTKVFEGPYKDARNWYKEMMKYVEAKGKKVKNLYFYYTTCPKCAKVYGRNYVVAFAELES